MTTKDYLEEAKKNAKQTGTTARLTGVLNVLIAGVEAIRELVAVLKKRGK